ncbi:MAG: arylsulfatase A-like enzyme [Planctomycetota bacterium]|jgi:arylsulfatase A-like enzyme
MIVAMRVQILASFATIALTLCGGCSGEAGSDSTGRPGPRPNVVVLLADTLRADVLSAYGAEDERAPFLASLAQNGTVFGNTYSTSTWTAPSSASMLTGVYPDRHGVTAGFLAQFRKAEDGVDEGELEEMSLLSLARDVPTLAERMGKLGYATYGLSSNVNIGSELEFDRGFDRFWRSEGSVPAGGMSRKLREWETEIKEGDRPYFLYMHFNDVHAPYHVRKGYYNEGEGREKIDEAFEVYKSELGFLDFIIGNLYKKFGWDKNTLLVFVADHGEEFNDHGGVYHEFSVYNELSRVPFLIHAPDLGVKQGVVRQNTSLIDVTPTILGLLGVTPEEELDGSPLTSLCRSSEKAQASDLVDALIERPLIVHRYEAGQHLWSVIRERWKLIEAESGPMLFDLREDPGETKNLAEEHEGLVSQLAGTLETHRSRGSSPDSEKKGVEIDPSLLRQLKSLGYVR